MTTSLQSEMERLEYTIIEEGIPHLRREPLRRLLHVIDQLSKTRSAQYRPERELGLPGDPNDLRKLAVTVKSDWARIHAPMSLNSTAEALLMELLEQRDCTVSEHWLCTPKGKFRIGGETGHA
jgi:hypothetical protein